LTTICWVWLVIREQELTTRSVCDELEVYSFAGSNDKEGDAKLSSVYTIQPVVKPVVKPLWGLTTGCIVYTNIQPVVQPCLTTG